MAEIFPKLISCNFCNSLGFHEVYSHKNLDSRNQKFDLGNGTKTKKEEEAYTYLLHRDFPRYNFEDGKQEHILFTPPHYLHKRMDLPRKNTPEFKKISQVLNPDSISNIEAEDFEALLFYSFKSFLNNKEFQDSKNITVIQGWCRNWTFLQPQPKKGKGDEHDLIIIDGNQKLIILFEAKLSISNEKTIDKAKSQLQNQTQYLSNHHGHSLTPDWKIACVIAYQTPPQGLPCQKCKKFLLEFSSLPNLEYWWSEISSELSSLRNAETVSPHLEKNSYKRLVGRVVGFSSSCNLFVSNINKYRDEIKFAHTGTKHPITSSMPDEESSQKKVQYPKEKDVVGDERIKFFLTPDQRDLLANINCTKLLIKGGFGTGKSLLLKIKALELDKSGEKVAYVIGNPNEKSEENFAGYFFELTQRDFYNSKVEVLKARNLEEIISKLKEGCHIFWDECFFSNVVDLAKTCKTNFWMAETNISTGDSAIISFSSSSKQKETTIPTINLNICMRNSENIQRFAKTFNEEINIDRFTALKSVFDQEKDIPRVFLFEDNIKFVLDSALESYKNDFVMIIDRTNLKNSLDATGVNSSTFYGPAFTLQDPESIKNTVKSSVSFSLLGSVRVKAVRRTLMKLSPGDCPDGWNIMKWVDYLQCDLIKPNTLLVSDSVASVAGIEVKNVILVTDISYFNDVKKEKNSLDKTTNLRNSDSNLMLRAVAHLTVLLKVPQKSEEKNKSQVSFFKRIKKFAKVVDLRGK
jgi:hypothetical protein